MATPIAFIPCIASTIASRPWDAGPPVRLAAVVDDFRAQLCDADAHHPFGQGPPHPLEVATPALLGGLLLALGTGTLARADRVLCGLLLLNLELGERNATLRILYTWFGWRIGVIVSIYMCTRGPVAANSPAPSLPRSHGHVPRFAANIAEVNHALLDKF